MDEQDQPVHFSLSQKAAVFLPAATLACGLDAVLHAPLPLAVGGVIGAFVLARKSPEIYGALRQHLPLPASHSEEEQHRAPSEWSFTDRLLGRHLQETEPLEAVQLPEPEMVSEEQTREEGETDDEDGQQEQTVRLPTAPPFAKMCHLITKERLVLCYTTDGPIYGTVKDLLSMLIVGKPGRGKTTALTYYVAMLLHAGAEVHVWDPHGSLSELCGIPHMHYADELDDIHDSVVRLESELEERRTLFKAHKQVKHPLLLLIDELPIISQFAKKEPYVFDLLQRFVLEARKWNCYFIGSGQSTDAEILPTRIADSLSSRIVFYVERRKATQAGVDLETAKKFLPVLKPDSDELKGKMIFDCSRLSEPVLGAIPAISAQDVLQFLRLPVSGSVSQPVSVVSQSIPIGNVGNTSGNATETRSQAVSEQFVYDAFPASLETVETPVSRSEPPLSPEKLEMIKRMKELEYPDREIAQLMELAGRKYGVYKQCLTYLGYRKEGM